MRFVCNRCKREYSEEEAGWRCSCGGCLFAERQVHFTKEDIRTERPGMWRYDAAYPLKYEDIAVTYGEGLTPLVSCPSGPCRLRLKLDCLMPTGSFKDRGTVMVVNYLLKRGAARIVEDSSGNAGASVAGYCALGRIPCDIFVPAGNSRGKLTQIRAYGAHIHPITGSREDAARAAQEYAEGYAGHNWHPMFLEGTKSLAYELWEQNHFKAPENIVCVAGNGSQALGIFYGFQVLLENGQVERLPRLFVVQAENCSPIYREFMRAAGEAVAAKTVAEAGEAAAKTMAEGIALRSPNKGSEVVEAVQTTGGRVLAVSEEAIGQAVRELGKMGFYAEPTSAAAYAGLLELLRDRTLNEQSDVILMISGNGLKAGEEIGEVIG